MNRVPTSHLARRVGEPVERRSYGNGSYLHCAPSRSCFGYDRLLAFACEINRGAIRLERGGGSFENGHQLEPSVTAGLRFNTLLNAIDEVLAFHFERFLLLDVRD